VKTLNKPIGIDDQGNEVFVCQYSKKLVSTDKAIFLGALIPSVSVTFVCHPEYGPPARKQSKIWFDEMDANCNTCKNLERIQHKKCSAGFLQGVCKVSGEKIRFHPHDWMGKKCWEQR